MANARSLHRTLPENSVLGLYKTQYRNQNHGCERSRDIYVPPKSQNWAYSGLENKRFANTSRKKLWFILIFGGGGGGGGGEGGRGG